MSTLKINGPVALIILDWWGINPRTEGNAVKTARTPNLDRFFANYPSARLESSGEAVGVMEGQMGDSNVGHLNIGAGRIVYQDLVRLNREVREKKFFDNPSIRAAMTHARDKGTALHLMGLLSPGGVHSHSAHLYALLEVAKKLELKQVYVHAFLDGRDVPPSSAKEYVAGLEGKFKELGIGRLASISGRYYAMDRDKRWDRVEKSYRALVYGEGQKAESGLEAVEASYGKGKTDEFVVPTVIVDAGGQPVGKIEPNDAVIFFNFRFDRARELTWAFVEENFTAFARKPLPGLYFMCMTRYDETIKAPVAYPPQELKNTLGEVLAKNGLRQLRIAETEKYAHVTFFFNGGEETPFPGEERILIPSPKVATYDLKPEMSAYEVTDAVLEKIRQRAVDCIILNYANLDMVGHTGVMEAAVKAVEAVDTCVGKVVDAILAAGGVALLTADHGNVEQMIDYETGEPYTAHTLNPVPVVLVGYPEKVRLRSGILADVSPTLLEVMGIPQPEEMTGHSLIVH